MRAGAGAGADSIADAGAAARADGATCAIVAVERGAGANAHEGMDAESTTEKHNQKYIVLIYLASNSTCSRVADILSEVRSTSPTFIQQKHQSEDTK